MRAAPEIPAAEREELQQRAAVIHERLIHFYGAAAWEDTPSALEVLVSTILSQNTNDRNRDLAYRELEQRFSSWEAVRDAPAEEVIDAIRGAGLANQKGPRIQAVLCEITRERGSLDLSFLAKLPREEAEGWLRRFKGIGPKTAAIVLNFSLGIPAFPVDTHIYRVTGRIGLRPPKMSVEDAHRFLEGLFQPAWYTADHLNLIHLGREICTARRAYCERCPLVDVCDTGRKTRIPLS
ncbi:MAG TPA: hypothetical protein VF813_10850 [Anaerolineaceae bacterium]